MRSTWRSIAIFGAVLSLGIITSCWLRPGPGPNSICGNPHQDCCGTNPRCVNSTCKFGGDLGIGLGNAGVCVCGVGGTQCCTGQGVTQCEVGACQSNGFCGCGGLSQECCPFWLSTDMGPPPCKTPFVCSGGLCICPQGKTNCNNVCVDTQSDNNNCGACGNACKAPMSCSAGKCVCPAGLTDCDGTCANLQSDNLHCGSCPHPCPQGVGCAGGKCDCVPPLSSCSGVCVNTQTDSTNCGTCGHKCPPASAAAATPLQKCVNGACQCVPHCAANTCGSNGCGGTCSCAAGSSCCDSKCCAAGSSCCDSACCPATKTCYLHQADDPESPGKRECVSCLLKCQYLYKAALRSCSSSIDDTCTCFAKENLKCCNAACGGRSCIRQRC